MGFSTARAAIAAALRTGDFEHETRDALAEKNLLAIGDVDQAFVLHLLHRTRGHQYSTRPHDWSREVVVHVFRPVVGDTKWYVKAYLLDDPPGRVVFISVHEAGAP